MKSYTFLKMIEEVLRETKTPMSSQAIWDKAKELGLDQKIASSGKTPWYTIGAQLYVDMKDNNASIFKQVSSRPALFGLKELKYDLKESIQSTNKEKEYSFKEINLHTVLVKYLYSNPHFKCYAKTINQSAVSEKSKTKDANMWVYADLIGVNLPFDEFDKVSLEIFKNMNETPYKIFSFEMKVDIDLSNFKKYYFQAVSNSSWAHEGYLVCCSFDSDPELLDEFRILNSTHGIGLIVLNLENPTQSEIVFSAQTKDHLNMFMLDKIIRQNKHVKEVFNYVNNSFRVADKSLLKLPFDEVLSDEEYDKYAKEILKINQ